MKIAVVGGGISGASSAFLLKKRGHDVVLFESSAIGGKAQTLYEEGYTIETGPNGFLDNKEEIIRLINESGFDDEILESSREASRRFIFSNGRLYEIPENPIKLLGGDFLSVRAKLRVLGEYFVPPVNEDETLANFVRRRLGDEILNKLIGPMACGVYAGDPEYLSMDAVFPKIKEIERTHGSLVGGLVAAMLKEKKKASAASGPFSARLLSFKRGVGSFVTHLVSDVTKVDRGVDSLKEEGGRYRLVYGKYSDTFDGIVFAIPAYSLSRLLGGFDEGLAFSLMGIRYAPISVVAMGFKKEGLPDIVNSFGYLFELSSIIDVIGVLFDSSMFKGRAGDDRLLVRLMVGGDMRRESALSGDVVARAVYELQRSASIYKPFEFCRLIRHPRAIPQYGLNHREILQALRDFEESHRGLFITGNAFYGVSLNDCVKSSYEISEKVG